MLDMLKAQIAVRKQDEAKAAKKQKAKPRLRAVS